MRVARGRMGRGRLSLLQRYTTVGDSHTRLRFVCAQYILSHFRRLPREFQLFPRMMHAPETVPAVCEHRYGQIRDLIIGALCVIYVHAPSRTRRINSFTNC